MEGMEGQAERMKLYQMSRPQLENELAMLRDRVDQFERERNNAQEMYGKLCTDHNEELSAIIKALDFESDTSVPNMGRMRKAVAIAAAAIRTVEG